MVARGFDAHSFHPEARAALDRAGEDLATRFVTRPRSPGREEPFPTRHHVETIRSISVNPVSAITDGGLATIGWCFHAGGEDHILDGDAYLTLRRHIEKLQAKDPFRDGFSEDFLAETIITWCRDRHEGVATRPLAAYLLENCAAAFTDHHILVPLSHIEIERDFAIGAARVVTLGSDLFSATRNDPDKRRSKDKAAGTAVDRLEKELGHTTAVEVHIAGEPGFARSRALMIAHEIAGVLRFLSPAPVSARVTCPVQPLGFAPLPRSAIFTVKDGRIATDQRTLLHSALANWKLASREIDRLGGAPLANLHILFDGRDDSPFAAHIRGPFMAYCRALGRFEMAERLVETISALEALLLHGQNEPLQHVVGERLAFLTAVSAEERFAVLADYKRAYGLRSGTVHHLRGIDDVAAADRLCRHAFIAFYKAIEGLTIFDHPDALFDAISRIKFSGGFSAKGPASNSGEQDMTTQSAEEDG